MSIERQIYHPSIAISPELKVEPDDIFIFPIPRAIYGHIEQLWTSFVNKMVSLTYFDNEPCFSYATFECIDNKQLKNVASTTHFKLKELALKKKVAGIDEFMKRAKPIDLDDPENESALIIRKAIIDYNKGLRPEVEFLDLKKSKIHPDKRAILTGTMNHGIGLPLFVNGYAIGILWGIANDPLTEENREELRQQCYSLFDVIDFVVSSSLDEKTDIYLARKNIEKADTHSNSKNLFYTRVKDQPDPVTSIIFRSHVYNKEYRMDASYIIPTSNGYAISMKQFIPEVQNKTGVNILMIPGFFCRRSVMDKLAKEMALRHGYRVFSMDLRGRSKQTLPKNGNKEGWTVDNYVQDDFPEVLRWLRTHYPKEKTIVMGHSMGGMIPRFYSSSYEKIKEIKQNSFLPDPNVHIKGIVSITSPNYISIRSNFFGIDALKKGLSMIPSKMITDLIFSFTSFSVQTTFQTIDLKRFFKFLLNLHESLRPFSYDIGTKMITIQDFVGYKEITPSEWYFLVEDVFCEESVSVIMQFIKSQLSNDKAFVSSDGKLNYTEDLKNLKLPLYTVLGTVDRIVPSDVIEDDLKELPQLSKDVTEKYEQGHLGIVFHPKTVEGICAGVHKWIQSL